MSRRAAKFFVFEALPEKTDKNQSPGHQVREGDIDEKGSMYANWGINVVTLTVIRPSPGEEVRYRPSLPLKVHMCPPGLLAVGDRRGTLQRALA
ncbi:MAG: hypothetical protein WC712_06890 [Candidatus Brocadiia bacterium]